MCSDIKAASICKFMAGVGEASAVLGTIQVGFSLARSLYACVSEFRSAREDISRLATDVEVTLVQAQELEQLISNNDATKILNEHGLTIAKQCSVDSSNIVQKLLKLLTKAGVSEVRTQTVKPEDIDVSKFRRAAWLLFKPDVLVVKRELDSVKLQMLVARSCIEYQSAPSAAARDAAFHRIAGLEKSREVALRLLREAELDRIEKARSRAAHATVEVMLPNGEGRMSTHQYTVASADISARPKMSNRAGTNTARVVASSPMGGDILDRVAEQVRDEQQARELEGRIRQAMTQETQKADSERKEAEALKQKERAQAVESYQLEIRQKLDAMKQRSEETKQRLQASFSQDLPQAEIQKFLDAQYGHELQDDFAALIIDAYKALPSKVDSVSMSDEPSVRSGDSGGRLKRYVHFMNSFHRRNTHVSSRMSRKILPWKSKEHASTPASTSGDGGIEAMYAHIYVDVATGRCTVLPLDERVYPHRPCGTACNASDTLQVWTRLPGTLQTTVWELLWNNFPLPSLVSWRLHAACPIETLPGPPKRSFVRSSLERTHVPSGHEFVAAFTAEIPVASTKKTATGSTSARPNEQGPGQLHSGTPAVPLPVSAMPYQPPSFAYSSMSNLYGQPEWHMQQYPQQWHHPQPPHTQGTGFGWPGVVPAPLYQDPYVQTNVNPHTNPFSYDAVGNLMPPPAVPPPPSQPQQQKNSTSNKDQVIEQSILQTKRDNERLQLDIDNLRDKIENLARSYSDSSSRSSSISTSTSARPAAQTSSRRSGRRSQYTAETEEIVRDSIPILSRQPRRYAIRQERTQRPHNKQPARLPWRTNEEQPQPTRPLIAQRFVNAWTDSADKADTRDSMGSTASSDDDDQEGHLSDAELRDKMLVKYTNSSVGDRGSTIAVST